MVFVSIFAGFVPVSDLGHMVSIGTLFAFSLHWCNCYAKTNPDAERGFRVPFVPVFPIVGVIICLILMAFTYWKLGEISNLDGNWVALYFAYGKKRSKLNNPDK
jgi:APA family basic amino acid/polyamine antiporter